jgi:hypothetical protein
VRQLLGLDEFNLEIFEVGVVQLKSTLQGTIRYPALALEECDSLFQNLLELHEHPPPVLRVSPAQVCCGPWPAT